MESSGTKQLDRKLGFWSVYCISMGAMMGSGIFVLPGLAAGITGPRLYWAYILAGLFAMPAVLSKIELATAMPVAGGTYVYVDRSLGPWMGTIVGLGTWFSLCSKIAFALVGLGTYLRFFTDVPPLHFSVGVLALLVAVNIVGVSKASGIQIAIVLFCIVCLLGMTFVGMPNVDPALHEPAFPSGVGGLLSGAAFVFVSYAGVTKIASIAEEVHHPERNLPLGMLGAQISAMCLYAVLAWLITGHTSYLELSSDITPITTTAQAIFGPKGSFFFAVVAVVALISMSNAGVLATSRKPFAMSRDDMMPNVVQSISERFGTPWIAILMTGLLLLCLLLFMPVVKLAKLASGFKIFIFGIVNVSVIILRESGASWYKPTFRAPLYPWLQALGIIGGIWLLYSLGMVGVLGVAAAIVIGSIWYWLYARKRVTRRSLLRHLWGEQYVLQATEEAEAEEEMAVDLPNVIVPIFGGEPCAERLIQLASTFTHGDRMEVLRIEEVPESMQLRSHIDADNEGKALYRATEVIAEQLDADIAFHDLVTHNAKQALHHRALATSSEWIIMEWPTRRDLRFLVRHPLSWWIDHPPCDLAIFLDRGGPYDGNTEDDFRRILVLAEPGPYDSLLVHVADRLASSQDGATITLFEPISEDASDIEVEQHRTYHEQLASLCASPAESRIVRGSDPYSTIAQVTADYDILLIGAPPEKTMTTLFFGSREDRSASVASCSVLKVKAPRHLVHHRFELRHEDAQEQMILAPHIHHAVALPGLRFRSKADVFRHVGLELVFAGLSSSSDDVFQALQQRERRQTTALHEGVAISAPTVESLKCTEVVLVTLDQPIDFQSPGRPMVDVLLLVLAPRSDRQTQLWVLERLSRMAFRTSLLEKLRAAKEAGEMKDVVLHIMAEEQI
jgi:amino acid transporter/mannitol/fructose-specific phosphotransferase system IIA component (Ntr-type)